MIYINDIPSLRDPEVCEEDIDDRIEKIKLINGNTVQDYGHCFTGDSISMQCIFHRDQYSRLMDLWGSRQKVSFTDPSGNVFTDMRLVMRKVRYIPKFPEYLLLTFELWRV